MSGGGRRDAARFAWFGCKLFLGLAVLILIGAGLLVARIAFAPLSISALGPQIANALNDRFGRRYEFGFGETAIVRNGYAPALSITT
ncbi:MAG TPA: hypothetical protein VFC11_08375, partial [Methylocella sp.]|nr:hypothetical protein [Methylocella sp.]